MFVALLLGLALGAGIVATLGLSLVIESRAAQLEPTSAAVARNVSNLFRGTPLPATPLITATPSETAPLTLTPTPDATPDATASPGSIYARIPGRLRKLSNDRRMDWFIDNDMNGMVLDPPIDTESDLLRRRQHERASHHLVSR